MKMSEYKKGEITAYKNMLFLLECDLPKDEIKGAVLENIKSIENQAEENEEKNKIGELRDKAKLASEINAIIKEKAVSMAMFEVLTESTITETFDWFHGAVSNFSIEQMQNIKKALL